MSRSEAPSLQRETPRVRASAATLPANRSFCRTDSSIFQVLATYHALSDDPYRLPAHVDDRRLVTVTRGPEVDVEVHGAPELGAGLSARGGGRPAMEVGARGRDGTERLCNRDGDRVLGHSDSNEAGR